MARKYIKRPKLQAREKAEIPSVAAQLEKAAAPQRNGYIETDFEKSVPAGPCDFRPVPVTKPEIGNVYYVTGLGPAQYEGVRNTAVEGMDVFGHHFTQLYPPRVTASRDVMPARLEKLVRELAPPEAIKSAILAIKGKDNGLPNLRLPQPPLTTRFLSVVQKSNDPEYHAGVLRTVWRANMAAQPDYARAAQGMLAAEYAHQMQRNFPDALSFVTLHSTGKDKPAADAAAQKPVPGGRCKPAGPGDLTP